MKKVYTIFKITDTDIHVPSRDFYARNNEPQQETLPIFKFYNEFETEQQAEQFLTDNADVLEGNYVILPTYKFKQS